MIIGGIVGALIIAAVVLYFFSEQGARKVVAGEYDTFTQCLYDAGLRMYGSVTCSYCAQQRAMFGDSFRFIREIECDPRNPLPQTELCISKNIAATPTWIHEDASGNELFRFKPGVQSLERLAEVTSCPL